MIKLFIMVLVFVGLAFLAMAFNIIFRKNGKFPAYSVGSNLEMRKKGLTCVKCEEMKSYRKKMHEKPINPLDLKLIK